MLKAKPTTPIHIICPVCGSKNTNKINLSNSYCVDCCVEFDRLTRKAYIISYDGELIDQYVAESNNYGR